MARFISGLSPSWPAGLHGMNRPKALVFGVCSKRQRVPWGLAHYAACPRPCRQTRSLHCPQAVAGAHFGGPAASLASAADSAPSARDVPPIRPKLRMSDRATLRGKTHGSGGTDGQRFQLLAVAAAAPTAAATAVVPVAGGSGKEHTPAQTGRTALTRTAGCGRAA